MFLTQDYWLFMRCPCGFAALPVEDQEAEINLLYVAATRARERLTPNRALLRCLDTLGSGLTHETYLFLFSDGNPL